MDEDRLAQLIATQLAAQSQRTTETLEASEQRQAERLDQVQDYARSLEQKINILSSGGAGAGITQESYKEPRKENNKENGKLEEAYTDKGKYRAR